MDQDRTRDGQNRELVQDDVHDPAGTEGLQGHQEVDARRRRHAVPGRRAARPRVELHPEQLLPGQDREPDPPEVRPGAEASQCLRIAEVHH